MSMFIRSFSGTDKFTSILEITCTRGSKSESKKTMLLHMVLHEGRNREIRRMFESIGVNVLRLHRLKEADIELGNLKPGEYRRLKPYELSKLRKYLG